MIEDLTKRVEAYDFYQALRLLQAHWRDDPPIGTAKSPDKESIRFGQRPSLAFPPSTLDAWQAAEPSHCPKLLVHFFGLFGPNGPLPFHLTDYASRRQRGQRDPSSDSVTAIGRFAAKSGELDLPSGRKDLTVSAFCDVFHHRLISLFFRAWAVHQQVVDFELGQNQRYPFYIGSTFGLASECDEHGHFAPFPDALPPESRLYFAARLSSPSRNREGLEAILQEYFEVPTEVEAFVGRWFPVPEVNRLRLGESADTGTLGQTAFLGESTWQTQLTYRIRLGPLGAADFARMLPGGGSIVRLRSWVTHYLGEQFFGELQLIVKAKEVPSTRLGVAGRLGWDTWLKSLPFEKDPEDVIFDLDRLPPGGGAFPPRSEPSNAAAEEAEVKRRN